jgi:uncharacterized membrane protein YphA (DoxX/SURF4 family)
VYFGLYCLTTQILGSLFPIPKVEIPSLADIWPMRQIVLWTAAHIFRAGQPIYAETGSGDRTFDWVLAFCCLVLAALATAIWSILDRRRGSYTALYKWFRLFIRFALASQMIVYGTVKAIPLQMPFPYLYKLVEPYGNFSPMGVLWSFVGASPAYETFSGCAELLGGILLIIPRTTMFGALVCLADVTQVFVLNMTYDVPVKLLSFHLIVMTLFLLTPDLSRLSRFFFLDADPGPGVEPQFFRTRRANRIALGAQILFGIGMLGGNGYGAWTTWRTYGGARPKSPLYGIWDVDQMSIDGQLRPPLLTDHDRWRRAIFQFPKTVAFQRMDDTLIFHSAAINSNSQTLTLTNYTDKKWEGEFKFQRAARDRLTLDGNMDGHKVLMQLRLVDTNKFLLLSRGFHWIQEHPFNR